MLRLPIRIIIRIIGRPYNKPIIGGYESPEHPLAGRRKNDSIDRRNAEGVSADDFSGAGV